MSKVELATFLRWSFRPTDQESIAHIAIGFVTVETSTKRCDYSENESNGARLTAA
jgi:hypothetical protein